MCETSSDESRNTPVSGHFLAEYILGRRFRSIEESGWKYVRRAILDTLAVAAAAGDEPSVGSAYEAISGTTTKPVFWSLKSSGASGTDVALLNGSAAHALDFDDVSAWVRGHPSTVMVPALLAAAPEQSSLRQLSEAYAVGFEVGAIIVDALSGAEHYARGWHATSTIGVIMAAAAISRLTGATVYETRHALGLSASMSSGMQQNFGSTSKPLHAGLAARKGILAVSLAKAGATASEDAIEGSRGFLALYGDGEDRKRCVDLETYNDLLAQKGVNIKRYPCCYFTHHSIDSALVLREKGIAAEEISKIQVIVQPRGLDALRKQMPNTGLEGKFSMEYCVATALVTGSVSLHDFSNAAVSRVDICNLAALISCSEQDIPPVGPRERPEKYAVVQIHTRDRKVHSQRTDFAVGDARNPLSDSQFLEKVSSCLDFAGVESAEDMTNKLWESLHSENTVANLNALLASANGQTLS